MNRLKQLWVVLFGLFVLGALSIAVYLSRGHDEAPPPPRAPARRAHLNHAAFFNKPFATGQDVTRACVACHENAAREVMKTAHFLWLGDEITHPRTGETLRIGKKNLLNNFCLAIPGNWASCTRCHAGYGWKDESFDFKNPDNVDCLVCHDRSGTYLKGSAGNPRKDVDLLAAAKSVGYPQRENCGVCHNYGGGGLGVKHGDLDSTLDNPNEEDDVHMGREGLTCIDCHGGTNHQIRGKAYSVSVQHENGIGCTDCHAAKPHEDARLNEHTAKVACQTCHIPRYAKNVPTKLWWDWSKAGDDKRADDVHHYLKIKGEFKYGKDVVPEYYWFNLTVDRYLVGDKIAARGPTAINQPRGSKNDPNAKIWPFKVHRGKQPFDSMSRQLIPPRTSGEGGYWHDFNWVEALTLGAKQVGLKFSGKYDFVETEMFWPLSHMVVPKRQSLQCSDCHSEKGRLDWRALGYQDDPMKTGEQ